MLHVKRAMHATSSAPSLKQLLRRSAWAAALAPELLNPVLRASRERRLPAGGHAMRCGDPADCWVGVIDGLVKMSVSQPDGRLSTRCLASLFDPALYPHATRTVQLSQDEIGLLAAVSRQRAHQALHQLERAGLLRIEFGGVTVLDLPGLRRYDGAAALPAGQRPAMAPG